VERVAIRPFTEREATTVSGWRYEPPYDLYDGDPRSPDVYLDIDDSGFGYYVIAAAGDAEPLGFCCFGAEARVSGQREEEGVVDIGGGLRPRLLSAGLATRVFPDVIDFATRRFGPRSFRTAVATFNTRSLRLCAAAGFVVVRTFAGPGREFQELTRPASVESAR